MLRFEPPGHLPQLDVDDHRQLLLVKAVKHDRVVDAVEEFRSEVCLQLSLDFLLHVQPVGTACFTVEKIFLDDVRADVTSHDNDGVAEIDRASLTVGEAAVVEHLEEDIEDVWVRLLDFVEEHHAVRLAADSLAELAALLVADVARRRADESRNGVFLHVLAHVDTHQRRLVIEQKLSQRAGQLGLTDAGRAHKNERADRLVRILQTAPGTAH